MTSALVGSDRLGYKVKRAIPFETPWRTVQISDDAIGLLNSRMILNLNPQQNKDISWLTPMKYAGIWWKCIWTNPPGYVQRPAWCHPPNTPWNS